MADSAWTIGKLTALVAAAMYLALLAGTGNPTSALTGTIIAGVLGLIAVYLVAVVAENTVGSLAASLVRKRVVAAAERHGCGHAADLIARDAVAGIIEEQGEEDEGDGEGGGEEAGGGEADKVRARG